MNFEAFFPFSAAGACIRVLGFRKRGGPPSRLTTVGGVLLPRLSWPLGLRTLAPGLSPGPPRGLSKSRSERDRICQGVLRGLLSFLGGRRLLSGVGVSEAWWASVLSGLPLYRVTSPIRKRPAQSHTSPSIPVDAQTLRRLLAFLSSQRLLSGVGFRISKEWWASALFGCPCRLSIKTVFAPEKLLNPF